MSLAKFKKMVADADQVTVTHYLINRRPVTSGRKVISVDDQGIRTLLPESEGVEIVIDWPSPRGASHTIDGRSLTWIGSKGRPLFTYHFPLPLDEAWDDCGA
ncbi:hypothetical protein [Streptomyces sp. NRRL F-5053]|uniref:hypothetical protein n=1 Tax=Streptomyces sp. NRRL F-5053 TaxID=1463854 RepID=UPI0004C93A26|nr:hypothetical protein [Streptomyces sp. NRRL F-5053]